MIHKYGKFEACIFKKPFTFVLMTTTESQQLYRALFCMLDKMANIEKSRNFFKLFALESGNYGFFFRF